MENLPLFYRKIGCFYFLISLFLAALIMLGIVAVWRRFKTKFGIDKEEDFFLELVTSLFALPLLIFPFYFTFSLMGFYRYALVALQVIFVSYGLHSIFVDKVHRRIVAGLGKLSFLSWLCVLAVLLFIYWPFVMPYAEKFNGHHHSLINMVQNLWTKGAYTFIPPHYLSYDIEAFARSPNFALFLSLFSLPYVPAIGLHILFIIPGIFAFLCWRLLKVLCRSIVIDEGVGDLAFLMLAFSYYNFADFSAIHFDTFSPLTLIYFAVVLIGVFLNKDRTGIPLLVLLVAFTFLVRLQLCMMLLVALVIMSLFIISVRLIKQRSFFTRGSLGFFSVLIFVLPAIFWGVIAFGMYASPFCPHDQGFVKKIFKPNYSINRADLDLKPFWSTPRATDTENDNVYPPKAFLKRLKDKCKKIIHLIKIAEHSPGINYSIEHFLPLHMNKGKPVFIKNIFCGLSNSLLLTVGFLGFALLSLFQHKWRKILLPVSIMLFGYFTICLSFFISYPKYPHYFGYLIAVTSAAFYWHILRFLAKWRIFLGMLIFLTGIIFWAYKNCGHSYSDKKFENFLFLNPYHKTPFERISRMALRTVESVPKEIQELTKAAGKGNILFMDSEPGAFMPSLLNIADLSQATYLENRRAVEIYRSRNKEELRRAFFLLDIKSVCLPGRWHRFDGSFIMDIIRSYKGQYQYVVPVEELLR